MILNEFFSLPSRQRDTELGLIETALFVEQTFGIQLSDTDISNESLGSDNAIRRMVETAGAVV